MQIARELHLDPVKHKTALWDAVSKLEREGEAITVQRPPAASERGNRGQSVVYYRADVELRKPLPLD